MRFVRPASLILGLILGAVAIAEGVPLPAQVGLPAQAAAAMQSIDAKRIAAHVQFLANDLLEGRGTGTRGGDIAANYIAAQFALSGLKPAGDNGSYLQKVEFVGVKTLLEGPSSAAVRTCEDFDS